MTNQDQIKPTADRRGAGVLSRGPITLTPEEIAIMVEENEALHRRKGEQTLMSLVSHPLFKLAAFLGNMVIAILVAWGTFAWGTVKQDIQDIRANYSQMQSIVTNYTSERLAIQQKLDGFANYQTEALNRGRDVAQRLTKVETTADRLEKDIAELRQARMK